MAFAFPTLEKYIWITEQLSKSGKFKFSDYCEKFHADKCTKGDFKSNKAFKDIDNMIASRELGLTSLKRPENDRGVFDKHGYYVLSSGTLVENLKFSDNDKLMAAIINRISSTKIINPFFTNANKAAINEKIKVDNDLCDKIIYKFTEYENCSPELLSKISKILNAFLENRRLRVKYTMPSNKTSKVTPLRLVNYNGQWYLYGISSYDSKYKYFKLSRIASLEMIDKFNSSLVYKFDEGILNENFGIGTGGDSLVAVIKFTGRSAQTIAETKWNEQQEIIICEHDNSRIMTIRYSSFLPQELVGKVLQYGAEAEILEPEELRNEWKNKITEMYQKIKPVL